MATRFDTITFCTDYGLADEFVGVVKSVIRSIAPHVAVIDLSHDLPAHDVTAGGLLLARSAQYLCPGVVLAVVDPGVGTGRRALAVEVGGGQSYLVGPDNGLLAPAVAMSGGATAAVELANPTFQLPSPGATFAGRDVFAPAAAHLCNGVPLSELGPAVEPTTMAPGIMPLPRELGDGGLVCQVIWVDRFGNCQLNAGPKDIAHLGRTVQLHCAGGATRTAAVETAFDHLAPGQAGLVVDSCGLLAVAMPRRSAADELRLAVGAEITLTALDADPQAGRPSSAAPEPPGGSSALRPGAPRPVTLTPRRRA